MDQMSTTQQTNQNHNTTTQTIQTATTITILITLITTPALTITTDTIMETTMAILIHQFTVKNNQIIQIQIY